MAKSASDSGFRIRLVSAGIVILALLIVGRLFSLQVVSAESYRERADRQYAAPASGVFERGSIYFTKRDGTYLSAATTTAGFKVAISPETLGDAEASYEALSAIIPLDRDDFMKKAGKRGDPYEEIATRISKEDADRISQLGMPGVQIFKEKWRFYPGGRLAAKVLGFVAYKGETLGGRYGLERSYDAVLSRSGESLYVNFFAEIFSNISDTLFVDNEKEGDVVTSLEPSVQQMLERELASIQEKYRTESAGGIVIDPATGSIYAMGHLPDFDLNAFSAVPDPRLYGNPLVENVYELGSVIKPIVMAAGLDAGVVSAGMPYDDKGFVTVEGVRINNFDLKGRGKTTMQYVLSESLNTGMVQIAELLGRERMRQYLYGFGIGERTGIDLPNEGRGLVSNLESPRMIEYANAAFGQGIALTPIAAVRAFSALANGGMLVTPHLGQKVVYDAGSKDLEYPAPVRALPEAAIDEITRMMVFSVDEVYMSGRLKMERYSIAGKTGTAQIAKPDGTGYYDDRHMHSFFGYFPAYEPRFLVFLYAIDPKGVRYASETLIEPFMDLSKFLINYYEIPPDR